ncbi:MAG TPA: flagellar basal body L-ring protein FlgH [Syntrophobacteraceae bacterium]|nr:flagellar basal body L-ring protein FlgH [Syntrophobacteraceae bacterium]
MHPQANDSSHPEERKRGRFSPGRLAVFPLVISGLFLVSCATTQPSPPQSGPVVRSPVPMTPIPPPTPGDAPEAPTGSLWAAGGSGSLFQDLKARKVGDIVTITVSEEAKGSKEATTKALRSKDLSGTFTFGGAGLTSGGGTGAAGGGGVPGATFGPYSGQFGTGFTAAGATTRSDSMTAYMTATVVDVLPGGNLLIRGSRWTKVNDEMQQIVLEGIIRPNDITRHNTVLSQNIAEAKIFFVGKGPVTQHQKPGWAFQLLDLISPF